MKEKHEKVRLNASSHQSENERQLKKFIIANRNIYSISSRIRVTRKFHVLVETYAVLSILMRTDQYLRVNEQVSFAFLF